MTKHSNTCNMSFGRKDDTCPRCRELIAGDAPRKGWQADYYARKKLEATRFARALKSHDCKAHGCHSVCVAFDP